jgi:pectin methylesterase-like acyl-CoA thioesterase
VLVTAAVLAAALWSAAASAFAASTARVVSKTKSGTNIYSTIQGAVNAASPGDWVLIEPGVYTESVLVETPGLKIRGMNRNSVILDGQNEIAPGGRNGIEVFKTNNVSIENLTVRNFDREETNGSNGNEIWWNGGDGTGKIGAEGWRGAYLTAYDTGLTGGYGLFVSNSIKG